MLTKKKKNNVIKITCVIFALLFNFTCQLDKVNAIDFGSGVSGELNVHLGYQVQLYQGDVKLLANNAGANLSKNHIIHAGIGMDIIKKLNNLSFVNPFIGLQIVGNYGLNNEFVKEYKFNRFFNVNARFGGLIKINDKFSVNSYAILGLNVSRFNTKTDEGKMNAYSDNLLYKGMIGKSMQVLQDAGFMDLDTIYNETHDIDNYQTPYNSDRFKIFMSNGLRQDLIDNMSTQTEQHAETYFILNGNRSNALYYFFPNLWDLYSEKTSGTTYYVGKLADGTLDAPVDSDNFTSLEAIRFDVLVGWRNNENGDYVSVDNIDWIQNDYYENNGKFVLDVQDMYKDFINSDERFPDRPGFIYLNDGHFYHKIDKNFIFYKDNDPNKWYYIMVKNISSADASLFVDELVNESQEESNVESIPDINLADVKQWLKDHGYEYDKNENHGIRSQNNVGLNVGLGVEGIYNFNHHVAGTLGVEYVYSQVKFDALKVQTHTIGIHFGVRIG